METLRTLNYTVAAPFVEFRTTTEAATAQLKNCELAARTCYASETKDPVKVDGQFMEMLIGKHHESVLEHASFSVVITTDRATSHQLVRHRLASYSQQSDRYVRHTGSDARKALTFMYPMNWTRITNEQRTAWTDSIGRAAGEYITALEDWKWKPEEARIFLPHSLATKICITANMREWRHIFRMRLSKAAMPSIRAVIYPVYAHFKRNWPWLVYDIDVCKEAGQDMTTQNVYYSIPD